MFIILGNRDSCSYWQSCSVSSQSSHQASSGPWTFSDQTAYWHHLNLDDFPETPLLDPRTHNHHHFLPLPLMTQTGLPPLTTLPPHRAELSGTQCLCSVLRLWTQGLRQPAAAWPMAVLVCFRSLWRSTMSSHTRATVWLSTLVSVCHTRCSSNTIWCAE